MKAKDLPTYLRMAMACDGIPQDKLAEVMHVSAAAVSYWVSGRTILTPDRCRELARVLPSFDLAEARGIWMTDMERRAAAKWERG